MRAVRPVVVMTPARGRVPRCIVARWLVALLTATGAVALAPARAQASATLIVVLGAQGTPDYGRQFATWVERWEEAARQGEASCVVLGREPEGEVADREQLLQVLEAQPRDGSDELWLVLIGHGTYDGRLGRFNLRGPDISDSDLARAIAPLRRPVVVINCSSSSGPFLNKLSAPNRVVVTATRSGDEHNLARFGDYLAGAIADRAADYDKDGQTSLLEAFLSASRRVAEFYGTEARLATEHSLLDDNGDGLGTPADWFQGIRAVKRARDGASHDGHRAHQVVLIRSARDRRIPPELLGRRNELELAVATLREKKDELPEEEYYRQLEAILLELARIHEQTEEAEQTEP